MSNHPTPAWDPRDISVLRDQRHAYDAMRERCPVAHDDFLDWSLLSASSPILRPTAAPPVIAPFPTAWTLPSTRGTAAFWNRISSLNR